MPKTHQQDTRKRKQKARKFVFSGKIIRSVFWILTAFFLIFSVLLAHYSFSPVDKKRDETIIVDIRTGSSFSHIMHILDQEGLIKNKVFFYCLAVVKKARLAIRAGEYEFSTSQTPWKIIDKLVHGDVKVYRVVIPEDLSMREVAKRLYEHKLINKEIFFELAKDEYFLKSLNIPADSIEGYLFPDTYNFERWMNTRRIMKKMVDNFWEKVTPEIIEKAQERGLDIHQLITLASIIGKEAANHAEKPTISAVFHNRLKRKMPLQSDPTAVYDLDDFEGKIVRSHLRRKSPYNTYVIRGLPPGPIANPGLTSIKATLYPAPVGYLYFVSKRDGTHHFSSSLAEHNRAVNQYVYRRDEQIQTLTEKEPEKKE
jgi:UPF0755 protein